MSTIGNLVFFVFGGFMCFRLAGSVIAPFGREVRETEPPGGPIALIMNIIWIILPGLELAIMHLLLQARRPNAPGPRRLYRGAALPVSGHLSRSHRHHCR